jgi:hypothetical protein
MTEVKCFGVWEHDGRGLVFLPFLGRRYALPSVGNPPGATAPLMHFLPLGQTVQSLSPALRTAPKGLDKQAPSTLRACAATRASRTCTAHSQGYC